MFPVPARVLFPSVVSLISGLWAAREWRDHAALTRIPEVHVDMDAVREAQAAAEQRRVAAEERAERQLRLAEAREARLARREAQGDGGAAG